ncbi:hypothetical protein FNYG_15007 [Fusarium nygamai]|uniref:NmrA-like domain-containing protein n=1 Tax=Gibberella nygamai TaxID=42673 RepID=A0A2K0ULY5_GIBNY|nr:hypothetical protein FNYG_15007 [Fusarium nygamai]
MPIAAVLGATGTQGGSVCQALLESSKWQVRGISRNPSSDAAKKLVAKGIQVVHADLDDEISLIKAFEGATAIFCVSNFGELAVVEPSLQAAADHERDQLIKAAKAAAVTPTLTHFICSALPPVAKLSGGRFKVPHLDSKHEAVDYIQEHYPSLAVKTTVIWLGWYVSNFTFALFKPHFVPSIEKHAWLLPSKETALLPVAGDSRINTGVVVRAVLEQPEKTHGKFIPIIAEYVPMSRALEAWEKTTGRSAIYGEISDESFAKTFGPFGTEMAGQLRFSEEFPNWDILFPERTITIDQLNVRDQVVGLEAALESLKEQL